MTTLPGDEKGTDTVSESLKPVKWYRNLDDKKGRLEAGAFIVEGDRAIRQILAGHPSEIVEILSVDEPPPAYSAYPVRRITGSQLLYICNTRTPQGSLAVVRMPAGIYTASLPAAVGDKVLLLEDVQDPGNVGTLIRTAAAFDFSGVIMSEKCADPLSPKCVQSTAGAVLSVWLRRAAGYLGLAAALKKAGYSLVAADVDGEADLAVLKNQNKLVLALGNEGAGLSAGLLKIADYRVRVPIINEKAESLNVAACGAICMYLSSEKSR